MILLLILTILTIFIITNFNHEGFYNNNNNNNNIPIFLINLDRNKDRLEILSKRAKKLNLNITRFNAYDGSTINPNVLIHKKLLTPNHFLRKGQIGCALSHYAVWQKINTDIALVLEDDVIIPDDFSQKLKNILQHLPQKWDLVFLGGCNIKGKKINQLFIKPTHNYNRYNLCLHAYLVNKKSIKRLNKHTIPLYRPIDSQLRDKFNKLNVYYVYPNIISQNKEIRSTRRDIDGLPQSQFWLKNHDKITLT